LQELQKKYKDDREKLTQETMKLYQQEGVNPAGGCLPILVQMPLLLILWKLFVNFEFNEGFLWVPDLGQADPLYIMPILYIGVIFAQSYFMSQGNKQMLQQQILINAVFIFFVINFPAGVTLYWIVSMLVQVFQYWLLKRGQPAPVKAS
jgi:YidC/Oxa1 family membrane protein insertase